MVRGFFLLGCIVLAGACSETSGPAVAVQLQLYSIDGVVIPAPVRSASGASVTLGKGLLQGTSWGHACGFSAGLAEGPLTTVSIASCRLQPGEERIFVASFNDVRFPAGAHEFRFVP